MVGVRPLRVSPCAGGPSLPLALLRSPVTYPPPWRRVSDLGLALELMAAHPLALLFNAEDTLRATRVPFLVDLEDGRPARLRAHLNGNTPQAATLDGSRVLVVFSGPASYVSPNWRVNKDRGGTYDFEQVTVRGTARVVTGETRFRRMIDDLSSLIEPQYPGVSDAPVWQTSDAAPGYIERLLPHVTQFVVEIEDVETISKLHQQFPEEDRRSIADHLDRSDREDARAIADRIRRTL